MIIKFENIHILLGLFHLNFPRGYVYENQVSLMSNTSIFLSIRQHIGQWSVVKLYFSTFAF